MLERFLSHWLREKGRVLSDVYVGSQVSSPGVGLWRKEGGSLCSLFFPLLRDTEKEVLPQF